MIQRGRSLRGTVMKSCSEKFAEQSAPSACKAKAHGKSCHSHVITAPRRQRNIKLPFTEFPTCGATQGLVAMVTGRLDSLMGSLVSFPWIMNHLLRWVLIPEI